MASNGECPSVLSIFFFAVGVLSLLVSISKHGMERPPALRMEADSTQSACWKEERLTRILDTACSNVDGVGLPTCTMIYSRDVAKAWRCYQGYNVGENKVRCFGVWASLAVVSTGNWSYDPWEVVEPHVLHARLIRFIKHPGFAAVC